MHHTCLLKLITALKIIMRRNTSGNINYLKGWDRLVLLQDITEDFQIRD